MRISLNNGFCMCTNSNALPRRSSPHSKSTQMHGRGWMPSLSIHRTSRPNTMHYRSWSRSSTQNGRCCPETSVKVCIHCYLSVAEELYEIFNVLLLWTFFMFFFFFLLIGIKKYIVNVIIKLSSTPESLDREKVYLNKLNMILVQVSVNLLMCNPEYTKLLYFFTRNYILFYLIESL